MHLEMYYGRRIPADQPTAFRRYALLKRLYEAKEQGIVRAGLARDIFASVNLVQSDLDDLKALGLVDVDLRDTDKTGVSSYRWKRGVPFNVDSQEYNLHKVAEIVYTRGRATLKEIVVPTGTTTLQVTKDLRNLQSRGLIKPAGTFPILHEYHVKMSENGVHFWENCLVHIYNFLADNQQPEVAGQIPYLVEHLQHAARVHRAINP